MATTETIQMPALGEHGEPCEACGAPLAADQRYCLNCGRRRGELRVDYLQYLVGASERDAAAATQAMPTPAPPEPDDGAKKKSERDFAPLAAVGGIAVLGLMLLVGVLIGKGNGSSSPAPAPVVRVSGAPEGSSTTAGAASAGAAGAAKKATASAGASTGAKAVKGGLTGTAARNSGATVQASAGDLNSLATQTGAGAEDQIKKLPDKIATPGKPPPIDKSKPPGGGGGGVTIK